jgi:hypothetical protein
MVLRYRVKLEAAEIIPLLQWEEGLGEEAAALLEAPCLPPLPSPLLPAEERGQEGAAP